MIHSLDRGTISFFSFYHNQHLAFINKNRDQAHLEGTSCCYKET